MKKKLKLVPFLLILVLMLGGCGKYTIKEIETISPQDTTTWCYEENARFVAIDYSLLKDGSINGIEFVTYVDLDTGVMYLYIEKYNSGYGVTWNPIYNVDGTLSIYENLEYLRGIYNWRN